MTMTLTTRRSGSGVKRRAMHVTLLAGLTLSLSTPARSQSLSRRLENGSTVSVRARNQALSAILSRIETTAGVKVEVEDVFGRPAKEVLARRLTLTLKRAPFWEAVRAIQELTGLKLKALEDGKAILATRLLGGSLDTVTAEPLVAGAFLLKPELSFANRPQIRLRPEPWIRGAYAEDYRAKLTFKGGRSVEFKPTFPVRGMVGRFTSDIVLPIDPKLDDALPDTAERLELEATLMFAVSKKTIKTPPLSALLAKRHRFGDKKVVVQKVEKSANGKVTVDLEVTGTRLDGGDVELVAGRKTWKPSGFTASGTLGHQSLQVKFDAPAVIELKGLQLKLNLPSIEKRTFGAAGELEGKTLKLGDRRLKIWKARPRGNGFSMEFEVSGGKIVADSITLTSKDGKEFDANTMRGSTEKEIQRIRASWLDFPSKTSFADCGLTVAYPSKGVTRVVKNLPAVAATPVEKLGLVLRVLRAGLRETKDGRGEYNVGLRLSGPRISPDDVQLLDPKGRPVVETGWSASGSPDSAYLELAMPTESVRGGLARHRLRLAIPDKIATHVLKATFEGFVVKAPLNHRRTRARPFRE